MGTEMSFLKCFFVCLFVYVDVGGGYVHMCVQECSAAHARRPEEDMFLPYCPLPYSFGRVSH